MVPSRILSLSPAATDILARLGLGGLLIGITHECPVAEAVQGATIATVKRRTAVLAGLGGAPTLEEYLSPYVLAPNVLRQMQPDLIFTEGGTEWLVGGELERLASEEVGSPVQVVTLSAGSLADVAQLIRVVCSTVGREAAAEKFIKTYEAGFKKVAERMHWKIADAKPPVEVLVLADILPMTAGPGWLNELLGKARAVAHPDVRPGEYLTWQRLVEVNPDTILLTLHGKTPAETGQVLADLIQQPELRTLRAFKSKRIYLVDARNLFLPGPGLAETLEVLVDALHPEAYNNKHIGRGWSEFF